MDTAEEDPGGLRPLWEGLQRAQINITTDEITDYQSIRRTFTQSHLVPHLVPWP